MKHMTAKSDDNPYLGGKLLLAMPTMADPRFEKAVIFICSHDANGAMGLVINQPMYGLQMGQLFRQLDIPTTTQAPIDQEVLQGGPVDTARGFILHTPEFSQSETTQVNEQYAVTGTIEALKSIALGEGPLRMLFALGYSGWTAGQLDRELLENSWLVLDAEHDLLFNTQSSDMWDRAIARLGVNPLMLSGLVGQA